MKYFILSLLVSFGTLANIFDDPILTGVETATQEGCTFGGQLTRKILQDRFDSTFQADVDLYKNDSRTRVINPTSTITYEDHGSYCKERITGTWERVTKIGDNEPTVTVRNFNSDQNGGKIDVRSCPSDDYPQHTMIGAATNAAQLCYDPTDLEFVDSCSVNDPFLPVGIVDSPTACFVKDDNSQCSYTQETHNGQAYYAPSEGGCYATSTPLYQHSELPISGEACGDIGNGVIACPEQPQYCSTNNCPQSCGTVTFDNVTQYLCFDNDTDSDGIGDYKDPDIDDDGILNEDDSDVDGDGIDNVDDDDYVDPTVDTPVTGVDVYNVEIDNSGVEARLDAIRNFLETPSDYDSSLVTNAAQGAIDNALSQVDSSMAQSEKEMGGRSLSSADTDFVNTLIGTIDTSTCVNPVIHEIELDLCSKATTINELLYWIFAALTTIFLFHEFHNTIRMRT